MMKKTGKRIVKWDVLYIFTQSESWSITASMVYLSLINRSDIYSPVWIANNLWQSPNLTLQKSLNVNYNVDRYKYDDYYH